MKIWLAIMIVANLVFWFKVKKWFRWLNFIAAIFCLYSLFSTPIIHTYYWLLRKTGIREPAKVTSMEYLGNGEFRIEIDKLDPGEIIKVPVPFLPDFEWEEVNENEVQL